MPKSFFADKPAPPAAETLGWELVAEYPEEGRIEIAFHPNGTMLNPRGTVQGGFVSAMLDDTMGPALVASTQGREMPISLDINVSFVSPVYPGRVLGKGRVVSRTKKTAFLEAELFDMDDKLLARATSTARIVEIP